MDHQRFYKTLLLVLAPLLSASQNIGGTWVGNCESSLFVASPVKIIVEMDLYKDSLITGASHFYYKHGRYEHHKISGKYSSADSTIHFSEDSLIGFKVAGAQPCAGVYSMKLSKTADRWLLTGKWQDKKKGLFSCPSTKVWFEKKVEPPTEKSLVHSRAHDIQQVIEVDNAEKDSVKIEVVDNGVIDNDTVSIFLDEQLLSHRTRLTDRPIILHINLTRDIQKLTLVAENMGAISPNTALMIITTRKAKYHVYLASNLNKNAVVEFFLKK